MKAQFWSMDVIFALVIFGIALVLVTFVWYNISNQYALASGYGVENLQAQLQSTEARLLGAGSPQNWNAGVNPSNTVSWTNVSVGLAAVGSQNLSTSKISTLIAMSNYNYQASKQNLGVGYDYYITFKSNSFFIRIGSNPALNSPTSEQVATVPVVVGGVPATMQIILWTNTTFGVT